MRNVFVGLTFNEKHSYHDYGMYLSKPPDFGSPEPKIQTIDIPGRDGVLDFSTAATGEMMYSNRQMTFTFVTEIQRERREAFRSRLWSELHGKHVIVVYDLDPDWYYDGIASVTFQNVESWKMKIVITVDAKPYKLKNDETVVTVTPTSFAAETIVLGVGSGSTMHSDFMFGTASFPALDLTQYTKLMFRWPGHTPAGTPALQIVDSYGAVYSSSLNANVVGTGFYGMDLNVSSITTIDKTKVYRILCQYRPYVELSALTVGSYTRIVTNDRMTVVPYLSTSAAVTVIVNGREYSLPAGYSQNFDIKLLEGENQLTFISDSNNATIEMRFREGRL